MMVRVTFQSCEATLTDVQISEYSGKVVTALEAAVGAQLRST